MSTTGKTVREWLDNQHPIYKANVEEWKRNERLLRGGADVLKELRRFQWETKEADTDAYAERQKQATYVNFPEMLAASLVGHIFDNAPEYDEGISFGTLGTVKRPAGTTAPSRAELIAYNVDGVGSDGSELYNYAASSLMRACATGHRWHYIDAPRTAPANRQQEIDGLRPYIVEFSPVAVPDWWYQNGVLQYAIVRVPMSSPKVNSDGRMDGTSDKDGYMLLVRKGCRTFDADHTRYARGGAFFFDNEKQVVENSDVFFDSLQGEVPFYPMFALRDPGTSTLPAMSRPLTTDLGNAASAYMNLSSAADFDAWDAAKSVKFLVNVSKEGYNLAMEMINAGSLYAPLLASGEEGKATASVVDSATGAVEAEVFAQRLRHKLEEAKLLASKEASGTPDASGLSKQAGFSDTQKPRLVTVATELEAWFNTTLYFFEKRFDGAAKPTAVCQWDKEFDLVTLMMRIERQFNLERLTGYKSPTLGALGMTAAANENGLLTDDADAATVKAEYEKAAQKAQKDADAMTALLQTTGAEDIEPDTESDTPAAPTPAESGTAAAAGA